MHAALIFTALISSSASAVVNLSEGREFGVSSSYAFRLASEVELRKVVTNAVSVIERVAKAPWKPDQKLTVIHQTVEKVRIYRSRSWSRSPSTEQSLDLLIGPYESFPLASDFRKKNCASYYSTLKVDWEPTAGATPLIPGVKRALSHLKAICDS